MKTEIFPTSAQLEQAVAGLIEEELAAGIDSLVLAGGSTPKGVYQRLQPGWHWGHTAVFFGDERCVPPDDAESNYRMAEEVLLRRVRPASVHRMAGELGADAGAALYEEVIRMYLPLDLVLLGMGSDGHTASLFPGGEELSAKGVVTEVHNAPKPPSERISLTLPTLQMTRRIVFMISGMEKAEAVLRASRGEVPAGMIEGAEYWLDQAAASQLATNSST
ncbi:MAG: 6-phosphogluconolactonase [Candidatus Dormibacteraceae bacterium]